MSDNPEINVDGDVGRDVSNNVVAGRDVNIIHVHQPAGTLDVARLKDRRGDVDDGVTSRLPFAEATALVIEDNRSYQQAIKLALDNLGVGCTVAADLDEAIIAIRAEKFDLITLDMQLELLDEQGQAGLLLLDQMHTYQRGVPVIIISALEWQAVDVRNFFVRYQAFDFFQKPFDAKELMERIAAILVERLGDGGDG